MRMMVRWIESLGASVLGVAQRMARFGRLGGRLVYVALRRHTYNSAVRDILFKQVYFTAVQILPTFLVLALLLNGVVVGIIFSLANAYGLADYAANLSIGFVGLELTPFFAAMLVALRSGSAINTEVALMRVNRELDALQQCGVDPVRYEFFPRVVGGVISLWALTCVGLVVTLGVAYAMIAGGDTSNFEMFSHKVGRVLGYVDVAVLGLKSVIFGICVTLIPLAYGMDTPRQLFAVPISVLRGMMRVFLALFLVEIGSLALKFS